MTLDPTPSDVELLALTSAAFASWRGKLAAAFRRDRATEAQARRLATLVVAAVEGAMILTRAEQDTAPITDIGHELEAHLREQLPRD